MRIGLISDTHIPHVEKDIPPIVAEVFRDVDLILHAGDIYIPSVLDDLERIAPVLAATGDDDHDLPDTVADRRVKEIHTLELEGQMLLLVHVQPYNLTPVAGQNEGSSGQHKIPDIVVSGHAHYPMVNRVDKTLYINPGSPTFVHYRRGLGSVGILDIDANGADARILDLQQIGTPGYTGGTGFGPR
ncbi:MAG: metallophosphoesterase family protein [Desulfobacterales bacterium]